MQKLPPPRPKSKSPDDLEEVKALDAAESRAKAALRLMNEQQARAEAAEAEISKLRQAEMQRQLDAVAKAAATPKVELAPPDSAKPSMRPGVLVLQAKGLKVGIPLALLTPALALVWAGYQNYMDLQRQVKALTTIVAGYDKRVDESLTISNRALEENTKLKVTVAELSGYLVGVLPKAGVNVPGTGSPIQSDPLPAGARRPTPVNVRTPVPAPK